MTQRLSIAAALLSDPRSQYAASPLPWRQRVHSCVGGYDMVALVGVGKVTWTKSPPSGME